MSTGQSRTQALHRIPVYDVRLVQPRRPLRLTEITLLHPGAAARAIYDHVGLTDREHFACLFLNGRCEIMGAHIAAIGAQHAIGAIDSRAVLRRRRRVSVQSGPRWPPARTQCTPGTTTHRATRPRRRKTST